MVVDRKLYEFVCRAVGTGGVVEVVWVQGMFKMVFELLALLNAIPLQI
jgi:hypothetical protein